MADEEQVIVLKRGSGAWNAWRAEHPEAAIDLSDGVLRGLDLTGADLAGADLRRADLRGAVLRGVDLVGARLDDANLFKADLEGADLNEADLSGAQFVHCAQLQTARNWQSTYRDEELACGAAIPGR